MILNSAVDIKNGNVDVDAVYLGSDLIWRRGTPPTPPGTITLTASDFIQGGITNKGFWRSASNRIMCETFFPINGGTTITAEAHPVDTSTSMRYWYQGYYGDSESESGRSYESDWILSGATPTAFDLSTLPSDTAYIRIGIGYQSPVDEDLTPADLDRFIFTIS